MIVQFKVFLFTNQALYVKMGVFKYAFKYWLEANRKVSMEIHFNIMDKIEGELV